VKRDFRDKVVAITGASGGIGTALGQRFASAGARLCLMDMDEKGALSLAGQLKDEGAQAIALGLDVTDEHACFRAVDRIIERFGRLDVLINNAGITHRSAFALTETSVYKRVMEVNYFGSLNCTRAALTHLIKCRGLIVVTSSIAGFAPLLGRTGYSASKHALHGFFESLRAELKGSGVKVTMVCPGFTATDIYKNALDGDGRPTTHPQSTVGRAASPASVAEAVFRGAVKEKRLVVLSGVGRLTWLMTRFCPALYENLMARSLRSELER
jgi:NAD(P)-dependent dehydrogenase (short-subunit alcohol dehydrogenase family)